VMVLPGKPFFRADRHAKDLYVLSSVHLLDLQEFPTKPL
jgi:hypothetical protein